MSRARISVLIDTYNHEHFIEKAISSVLDQDMCLSDVEILVVDDGSTDRTPEIVRSYEPRVRLIQKSNGGQASAFNFAIPQCQGDIIAFLDGDDWWAPEKLRCVVAAMNSEPEVGIIGNGITEVFGNGDEHSEVLHIEPRFRIDSPEGAKIFRRRKSQLGTSRLTVRAEILRNILPIPEAIVIEADEYIFTLGAALSEVLILGRALTFYRIHAGNLYQISGFKKDSMCRKRKSLEFLVRSLSERLLNIGLAIDTVEATLEPVQAEADLLRLQTEGGYSWETVRTEWAFYRIVHENGPLSHFLFKLITLVPALLCPPRLYYSFRRKLAANGFYMRTRRLLFPIPEPEHVTRSRRYTS